MQSPFRSALSMLLGAGVVTCGFALPSAAIATTSDTDTTGFGSGTNGFGSGTNGSGTNGSDTTGSGSGTNDAGSAAAAAGGVQGLITELPATLEFPYTAGEKLTGPAKPGDGAETASRPAGEGQIPFQRYDLKVGPADGQTVRWRGSVDPARQVSLRVWNSAAGTWDAVARERGKADGQLVLEGAVAAGHIDGGRVRVLVTGEDPFADDLNEPVRDSFEDPGAFDFSMVHYTDSQYLAEGAANPSYSTEQRSIWAHAYRAVPEWIAANAEQHQIKYAAHTGDIIENWHHAAYADEAAQEEAARKEFEVASDAQKLLDDTGIPNGVLPGNHDNRTGTDIGAGSIYNEFFGPERYEALERTPAWDEAGATHEPWREDDNENHYDLFSAGGLDFIALYLGYDVTEEEVAWANESLEKYSDRNAMVLAHAYNKPSSNPDGRGSTHSHDGRTVSEGVVAKNENVFLVLSGHEHGVSIEVRKDAGTAGNNVAELLADYQFYEVPAEELGLTGVDGLSGSELLQFGSSYLRLLQFDVGRSELAIDTYSPLLDDFGATEYDDRKRYNGTEDDLRLPIQLTSRRTSFITDSVTAVSPTGREPRR